MLLNARGKTCVLIMCLLICASAAVAEPSKDLAKQHEAAVNLARQGKHHDGLQRLEKIIQQNPDFYPAKRDYVVISAWADDCETTVSAFAAIEAQSPLENYLVVPVSECMEKLRMSHEAKALLEKAQKKQPGDKEIAEARKALQARMDLDSRPEVYARLGSSESDVGTKEWQAELKYSQEIRQNLRGYVRLLTIRADDAQFETGDITRAGLGFLTWLNHKTLFDIEFSTDVDKSGEEGVRGNLSYYPNSRWELSWDYATFAEDVPLRGKAIGVKAIRSSFNASYHTNDYRWEWDGGASRYHFNDTNIRQAAHTSLGYAYELEEKREQRVILALYSSKNHDLNTLYYNPEDDLSATLNFRVDLVYDTRFDRHVDHITLYTGVYNQQDYPQQQIGGARYEKEIEFSELTSFSFSAEYANHVYDGVHELESSVSIAINRKL